MTYSRREFGKMALGSITVASAVLSNPSLFAADKPDSKFGGVQIGIIIPYSYHNMPSDGPWLLNAMVRDGIRPLRVAFGTHRAMGRIADACSSRRSCERCRARCGCPGSRRRARSRWIRCCSRWPCAAHSRASRGPEGCSRRNDEMASVGSDEQVCRVRKMYNDAGVTIYVFKQSITMNMPDEECDYIFIAAKTLGATVLSMEMPTSGEVTQRVGEFASKHKMMVGYHAHLQATPTLWDEAMSQSPYNGINLDIGHYTAGGNRDAVAFLEKHHDRITHVHFKDRKFPENGGQNVPWGQGDTPIIAALQLMKKKYKFRALLNWNTRCLMVRIARRKLSNASPMRRRHWPEDCELTSSIRA